MMRKKSALSLLILLMVCLLAMTCFACNDKSNVSKESPIQSIIITTMPKTNYYVGDKFSVGDGSITVYYENGNSERVPLTLNMISEFDSNEVGEQVLTVFYKDFTAYLTVRVSIAPVYSIQLCKAPDKSLYVIGEPLDVTGMQILVTYSNNYTEILDVTEDMIVSFSADNEGETDMIVLYGGKSCTAPYSVVKKLPDNIEISLADTFRLAYVVGDSFELTGGSFFVHYNDNTSDYLSWTDLYNAGKLTYVLDKESGNVFTTSALERNVYLYYNAERYQVGVTVNPKRPKEIAVMSDAPDQVLKGSVNFFGGQLYVVYNSKQTGYSARVKESTAEARRAYADGIWGNVFSDYFVLNNGEYVPAAREYLSSAVYYTSSEKAFADRYSSRKAFLYVKNGSAYQKAPDEYNASVIYYVPSNVRIFDFDDPVNVEVQWNDFDINVVGVYSIRFIVDGVFVDYSVKVVAPSPIALEIYPSASDVRVDTQTGKYYLYQDETIHITDWEYKIRQNNDTYSIISSTGTYSANVSSEMYVGNTFMSNHAVGTYVYDFSFTTVTGVTLTCSVPIEVRQRVIVSATVKEPSRLVYSVGDPVTLAGGSLRVRYINGAEGEEMPFTVDMLYASDPSGLSNIRYTAKDGSVISLVKSSPDAFTSQTGENKLYVYYEDAYYNTSYATEFDITVIVKALSIALNEDKQTKNDYILGEPFSMDNWEVLITYADLSYSTENNFTDNRWTIEGDDISSVGTHVITLYYGDKSDNIFLTYACTVHNDIVSLGAGKDFIGYTTEGKNFDFSGLSFTAVRENGAEEIVGFAALSVSQTKAGRFVSQPSEYAAASFVTAQDWDACRTFLFVKDGENYVAAPVSFDQSQEYYYAVDNMAEIVFSYSGCDVAVHSLVVSRKIDSVTVVAAPITEYVLDSVGDWDLTDLVLQINFNNGTTAVVKDASTGPTVSFVKNGNRYLFSLNDMSYYFEVKTAGGSVYTLADIKTDLNNETTEEYVEKDLIFSVADVAYNVSAASESEPFYCFKQRVLSVRAEIGAPITVGEDVTGVNEYNDTTVYLNEGLPFYRAGQSGGFVFYDDNGTKRFVLDDTSAKTNYLDSIYLVVEYDTLTVYKKLSDVASSSGFSIDGFRADKTGSQTIRLTYLLKQCSFSVYVRPNVARSISFVDENENDITELTVIENMAIDPGKISVFVTLEDADGDLVSGGRTVDFSDVTCSYDKTEALVFTEKNASDVYYLQKIVSVSYEGCEKDLTLTILKKSVSEIVMNNMPQQVYAELPETASAEESVLLRTNSNGEIGSVLVRYNNGTSEIVTLDDARLRINASQFNTKLVLNDGAEQSQIITIGFTDDNNVTKETSYNVIVRDRKYLTVSYDASNNLSFDNTFYCQYGTGADARPKFDVYYYSNFYMNTPVAFNGYTVTYEYHDDYYGDVVRSVWPTEVGRYKMVISYAGDYANNAFEDRSITIEITKKQIGISVDDITLTFGDKFTGEVADVTSLRALGIVWNMSGVTNGRLTGDAFVLGDTLDNVVSVSFELYSNNRKVEPVFSADNSYLIMNIDVGIYYVKPIITLKKPNYTVPEGIGDLGANLTVTQKAVKIVALGEKKIYGDRDPVYRFEVYDENDDLLGGNYYRAIESVSVGTQIGDNVYVCDPVTGIYSLASGLYQSGKTYYRFGAEIVIDPIFVDTSSSAYRLVRSGTDTDNVNDYHLIYRGDMSGSLDNYSLISYTSSSLVVLPAQLTVTAGKVSRPFGTSEMDIDYVAAASSAFCYNDNFNSVFGPYFTQSAVLYYDLVKKQVYESLTEGLASYDDWAVLYRNVEIDGFETVVYMGATYAVVPIALGCGTYVCRMSDVYSDVVANYVVMTEPFEMEITPVSVRLNVGSVLLYENSTVIDGRRNTLIDYFSFPREDFQTTNIFGQTLTFGDFVFPVESRGDIDTLYAEWLSKLVLGAEYSTGTNAPYLLSSAYLNGYTFIKERGTDTGVYRVTVGYNYSDNFSDFSVVSTNVEKNKNYFAFYYDIFRSQFAQVSPLTASLYDEDAYMIVLPGFTDLKYYRTDEEGARYAETYNRNKADSWTLTTEYSIDKVNYAALATGTQSVSYSIAPKAGTQFIAADGENYLAAGNYTGTLRYSFFADAGKESRFSTDYIYLGNSTVLLDNDIAKMLNYTLFGTVEDGELVFSVSFDYTIKQKPVTVYVENEDAQYNFSDQMLLVRVDGQLATGDRLNFLFDIATVYNSKTNVVEHNATTVKSFTYYSLVPDEELKRENMSSFYEYGSMGFVLTEDTIPMIRKQYYIRTEASDPSTDAYDIAYSGTYTIRLNDLGNGNYCLTPGTSVDKTFTVIPNEIPILLYNKAAMPQVSTTDFTFEETYAKKAYAPIDYAWTATTNADTLFFDEISLTLSSVTNSSTRVVGSARIGSSNYNVSIVFHGTYSIGSVSGREIRTSAPNSRTLQLDTVSSENDYYFFFDDNGIQRKIYYDTATGVYYYKGDAYTTYKTTTCMITDYYYDENGVLHRPQPLVNTPNTLYIYSEDAPGSGNRPVYVKRDPDTLEVIGYDIVSRDSSDYVNYSVVFVYLDNGVYKECDEAHKFTFVINPAEVSLYNFSQANTKDYDGLDAAVVNISKLTVNGALSTDPISVSDIRFTFERLDQEGSTYITIGGERYYLVSEDDMSSAGVFKVSAYYSDNYKIVFKGNGSYITSPSDYGVYTIKRVKATLEFNSESVAYLSKPYDGEGLTKDGSAVYSGQLTDFNDRGYYIVSKQSKAIVDNYSQIYYQLLLKGSGASIGATPTAVSAGQIATYDYAAGFYWFDFYGVFIDKDGNYLRYEDRDDKAEGENRWLNWNYTYIVNNKKDVNKVSGEYCDGIYEIEKRNIYIGINGQLPTDTTSASYSYLQEYSGVTTTRSEIETWLASGVVTVYVYDQTAKKFVPIADTYFADVFNGGNLTVVGGKESITNVTSSDYFELSASDITSHNANFRVVNSDIRFALKALEIEIMLTYTNTDGNNASAVTYGKTARENALNFTLSISEEELERFNSAIQDGNTYTATQVLEMVSYFNNAEFMLYSGSQSETAVFKFTVEGKSRLQFMYDEEGDYYYESTDTVDRDGVTYYNRLLVPASVQLDYTKYYEYHEWYELTSDAVSVAGKKYYQPELVTENDPSFRAGNGIPDGLYFERGYDYRLTEDTVFKANTAYYKKQPGVRSYYLVDSSDPAFVVGNVVPSGKYYTQSVYYALTSDKVFDLQKRYYSLTEYVFTTENATATANIYYQQNKFFVENEDDYFLSNKDYFVFTALTDVGLAGTNVQAETYYEYSDGRYSLTSDLTFVRNKLTGGKYYSVAKAGVVNGDNSHKKYYVAATDKWTRVADGTARASGVNYYVFIPTVYSQTQSVTEYHYYYANGKFYNVKEMQQQLDGDKNYYVVYVADKSLTENVSYYTEYEAIVKASGEREDGSHYYKAVLLNAGEDLGAYYAVKRLLSGRDYTDGELIPSGVVYEKVDDSDTFHLTADTRYAVGKSYFTLYGVSEELMAGDDVSGYYIVTNGYSRAGDTFLNADATYYKAIELTAGRDYKVNALIPDATYYTKNEGEDRYSYASTLYFSAHEKYYAFETVQGVSDEYPFEDLYTRNDGSLKKIVALTAGKDYVVSSLIGGEEVYYRSNDRFVRETGLKYRRNVEYFVFVEADGFILNSALKDYYVDSSSCYSVRELIAGVDYAVGDTIGANVVSADSFTETSDEKYLAGKLYYEYSNDGLVSGALVGSYSVPATGFFKAEQVYNYTVGDIAPQGVYVYENGRYVSAAAKAYASGKTYYTFVAMRGYIARSSLNDYFIDGTDYYSAIAMTAGVEYELDAPVFAGVCTLEEGRLVGVAANNNFTDGVDYYLAVNGGFIAYADKDNFYVDGTGYYSRRKLIVGTDYSVGNAIGENVFVHKYDRYVAPEELTYRSSIDYYSMSDNGFILGSDIDSYYVSGRNYYSFTLLSVVKDAPVGEDVFNLEGGMFIPTSDATYREGKDYYLRTNSGLICPEDVSAYYVDATGYYTLVAQEEGVSYTVSAAVPGNMFYEISADGICRLTRDEYFVAGKQYYIFRANSTYLPADTDISTYYFANVSDYSVFALIDGVDYVAGDTILRDTYTVDDKWLKATSGTYAQNKRYLVLEAAAGYIRYGNLEATYKQSGSGRYMAIKVDDYTVGEAIPANYYTVSSDGRLIAATGTFAAGKTYYHAVNNGFIYGANEKELFVSDARYYSFIQKDASSLYGQSAAGSYIKESDGRMVAVSSSAVYTEGTVYYEAVHTGLVQLALLGEYYVSGDDCYSAKASAYSSAAFVYFKDNEFVLTTDTSAQEGTTYYSFVNGGFVQSKYYSRYYVPTKVFRTDKSIYDYYRYGNAVPHTYENSTDDFYSVTVPGRVFEKNGNDYFVTEDELFIVGKEYYSFVPVTDFSERETVDGLYVFRKGYIRSPLAYATLRKAIPGVDYQVGGFVSGKFFVLNSNSVPFEVPNGNIFSANTDYYCMNNYYGMTVVPTYYESNGDGTYSVTGDRTFSNEKTYYSFAPASVVVGGVIPQGYYFVKSGFDFVLPTEATFAESVTYYTYKAEGVQNGGYVVKGLYEKLGDVYVVTGDLVMNGNKTYYRFTKDTSVNYSDPVLLYEKVGAEYVLTDDTRAQSGKEYYYFKQTATDFGYFTGSGAPYFSGTADLSSLSSGTYYTGANNFASSSNYSLKIVSTPFEVQKQVIHITGVEREYYDADKTNWRFILADDTELSPEVTNILYSNRLGLYQQLRDESELSADAGSYYTATSGNYYMTIDKSEINRLNSADNNNYYIIVDGVSVSGVSSDSVCIPLFIKRVPIVVSISLTDTVEYGCKPTKSTLVAGMQYSKYPNVSENQTVAQKQREFFNFLQGDEVIDFNAIIRTISTTDYNAGNSTSLSLLYNLMMDVNAINNQGYNNYLVSFGEIEYTIVQRRINIEVKPNKNNYDVNATVDGVSFASTPFTILYSDAENMFYDDTSNDYRSYSLSIETFSSGDNVYSVDNLSGQIIEIVNGIELLRYIVYNVNNNNEIVGEGTTVQELCADLGYSASYTEGMSIEELMAIVTDQHSAYRLREEVRYNNFTYDSIQALLNKMTRYVIEDENGNADYMAGINSIRLYDETKWYDSNNYILVSARTPIIIYPEIDSVGEYNDGGIDNPKYINLVADTEAVLSNNVRVNATTKEITNLSFILRLNMNGMKTNDVDYSTQYFDTLAFSSEYETYYYIGNNYSRELHVYYVSGGTEALDGSVTLNVGNVITVYVVVKENFNSFARRPDIKSIKFKIRLVEKRIINGDDTVVSVLPLADTTDTILYNRNVSENRVLAYNIPVQNATGEYTLYNPSQDGTTGVDIRRENYDMVSMRIRLTPAKNAEDYSFSTVVYENDVGKLVLMVTGGTKRQCYIRYYYKGDYYFVNTSNVVQSGVEYYRLSAVSNVDPEHTDDYYMVRNGLVYRADSSAQSVSAYYSLTLDNSLVAGASIANPAAYVVKYSEDLLSADEMTDLFDGNSHRITIYLDRVGSLSDLAVYPTVKRDISATYKYVRNGTEAFDSTRVYVTITRADLPANTKILNADYFIMKDGALCKPDTAYSKNGVDYYTVSRDSAVTASTLTADHYYYSAQSEEYLFTNYLTEYDALKKYYVYLSVDGDMIGNSSQAILSFVGGLFRGSVCYSDDKNTGVRVEGDDQSEILQDVYFYVSREGAQVNGYSGISYVNAQPLVSYYALKNRLAYTISYSESIYMRSIMLFPEQFYDSSATYLVTKSTAETIAQMVDAVKQSIVYISVYGSSDNISAVENATLTAPTRISFGSPSYSVHNGSTSEFGSLNVAQKDLKYGLYRMRLPITFNYIDSSHTYQHVLEYRLLITDNYSSPKTAFYQYAMSGHTMTRVDENVYVPSPSSPVTFSAGTAMEYYFNNTPITAYDSSTYVFDLNFTDDTVRSYAKLYLGLSDRELIDLDKNMLNSDYDLWRASGIGITIRKEASDSTMFTKVYSSVYTPAQFDSVPFGSIYEEGQYYFRLVDGRYEEITDYQIGDRIVGDCYTIDITDKSNSSNIYCSRDYTEIDWSRGRNILKVDYHTLSDEAIISIRLYQYYYDASAGQFVTDFVWQEYFRAGFYNSADGVSPPIDSMSVKRVADRVKYVGFGLSSVDIKLYEQTMTVSDRTDFDLTESSYTDTGFKNEVASIGNTRIGTEGRYVEGRSTITGTSGIWSQEYGFFDSSQSDLNYYTLSDAYGLPRAYTGNTTSITFSLQGSEKFFWYVAGATPYFGSYDPTSYLRQRGLAIVSVGEYLYFEFYKYNKEYAYQPLNLPLKQGFNIADGKDHTISITIGEYCPAYVESEHRDLLTQQQKEYDPYDDPFMAIRIAEENLGVAQVGETDPRGFVLVTVSVDGAVTTCVCPYMNDLSNVYDRMKSSDADEEIGDHSTTLDKYFLQGIYFTGIRLEGTMTIKDYVTYDIK